MKLLHKRILPGLEQSEIETQSHQHGALDYNLQAQLKKNKSL